MRRSKLIATCIFVSCIVSQVYAVGISPGRRTYDVPENGGELNAEITYWLYPPQNRYTSFRTFNPTGLNTAITGFTPTAGIECRDDGSLLIDWDTAGRPSTISVFVNVNSPDDWINPAVAGGDRYMADLAVHGEDFGYAILGAVSQIAIYKNYALRGNVIGLQDSYQANAPVQFGVEVTDRNDRFKDWMNMFNFAYSIDWESDGIIDQNQSGINMHNEFDQDGNSYPSTFKHAELDFEHNYSEPGDYLITLCLTDRVETTTLQIPINIIPEPATIILLGLGGLFIKKHPILKKGIA